MTKFPGSDDDINHFEANQTFILIWIGQKLIHLDVSFRSKDKNWIRIEDFDQEKGFI